MKLNERIKELRKNNKLTQKQFAKILEITEVSEQRYEYGTVIPPIETIIFIADYFNVSIDYLVGRTDNPEINK